MVIYYNIGKIVIYLTLFFDKGKKIISNHHYTIKKFYFLGGRTL